MEEKINAAAVVDYCNRMKNHFQDYATSETIDSSTSYFKGVIDMLNAVIDLVEVLTNLNGGMRK